MYDLTTASETPSLHDQLSDANVRGAFGLPADAVHELNAIYSSREVTDHDLDEMWVQEQERRDAEAAAMKALLPIVVPAVESFGRKFKGVIRVDGKRTVVGTYAHEADAWSAAYQAARQVLTRARQPKPAA